MKKKLFLLLASLSVACTAAGTALSLPATQADAGETDVVNLNFTDTMDGANFKAPAGNYGWKVEKGTLAPDNSIAETNQIGYLEEGIALNEQKYISLDFYVSATQFDIMLLPYADTVNPWDKTGVGMHCMASGWIRLDKYIDANDLWLGDYTGIGNGVDGLSHKLEIFSDGVNLTFKIDGVDAFTGATVEIPADSVRLLLRAPKGSYIDNLYIGTEKPSIETAVDFTAKLDESNFMAMALNGWKNVNGKYSPVDEGAMYNASATKYNQAIDLTGTKYISFDFYSKAATFDVGLLDTAAGNIWGNALYIHLPFSDGTIGVNDYVDCTTGNYLGGSAINVVDGKAHNLEILVSEGKVSYALDGTVILQGFDVPSESAYLVFRAVGTESYIDNLYIADSAPMGIDIDFATESDGNVFLAWNSAGWSANADGYFVANANWASTQLNEKLDLTKNQEITFDVFLSSTDADKQLNVGFFSEENLANASNAGAGVGFSLGASLWLGTNLGRQGWIADVAANLYNDTWHSVKISVTDGKMSIALNGVAYDALTTDIPANEAYMLLQSTSTANLLDNLKITVEESAPAPGPAMYIVKFVNYDGTELQSGEVEEGVMPEYTGATPTKEADAQYTYTFKGWDSEIAAATGDITYTAVFEETLNKYTVTWKNEDGTILETDENVEYGATPEYNGETPTKVSNAQYSYVFKGWDKEISNVTGDITYTATFEAIGETYVVTWKNEDGTTLETDENVEYGATPTYDGATPGKAGDAQYSYVFKGWDKEISAVEADATYTAVFEQVLNKYTVTWSNADGSVLETDENVEYGATPEYNGATPVKAADLQNTYEFAGWDKEISAVTGNVVYVAQFTATPIPVEIIGEESFDFADETISSQVTALTHGGWVVADGKYAPSVAGAMYDAAAFRFNKAVDLTGTKYISLDFYSTAKTFDIGFLDTAAGNMWGNAQFIHLPFHDGTVGVNTYIDCTGGAYLGGSATNVMDGAVHKIEIIVKDGKITYILDEAVTLGGYDVPSEKAYLVIRAVGTESYIDNLVIQNEQPAPEPNPYDGVFEKYGSGAGWNYKDGKYFPNASWSVVNSVEQIDFTENKEISFDVYLSSADTDKQFNVGLFASKVETDNVAVGTGLNFSFGSTVWVSTNYGRNGWASECVKDYFTDGMHSVKIIVIDKEITVTVDGEVLVFLTNGEGYTPTLTVDRAYLLLQGTSKATYIQNYEVKEAVVPPKSYVVQFVNWDGSVLQSGTLEEGTTPAYNGATPERAADGEYTYVFSGWDKEISAVTGDVTYTAQFTATEIPDDAQYFVVKFVNWDGTELQSGEILENTLPVYAGEIPTRPADKEYTYVFSGWDMEIVAATGDITYTAQFTATEIPQVETLDEASFDFESDAIADEVIELAHGGWIVKDGKYYPSVAGALYDAAAFRLNKAIDLTGTKYISLDFYSTAKTFDIGFLDTMATNMWGNAQFIHLPFSDGTVGVNTYVDCTVGQYLGGATANVMDGMYHNLKIVVNGGKIAYVLDGVEILSGFDVPSAYGYLVVRAVGEESYIDNLIISNEDIEYIPPVIDNSYDELSLDFTAELDGTKYFATYDVNGWAVKDGVFSPEYMPWAATYLKQPVDLGGEKYISFDFLAIKNNGDETQSQFNFMFLTDMTRGTCSGAIHCFVMDNKPVIVINRAMGNDKWIATCDFDWADGKYHNLMIIIKNKTITFEIDGKPVKDNVLDKEVVIELKDDQIEKENYFGLQATNVMSRIDNFKISNTYTEYVAPAPEEEILFDDYAKDFVKGEETGFVAFGGSYNWVVTEEGKLCASQNWSKVYLDKEVPLTSEKTATLNFNLSTQVSGHQFTVGFSTDKNSLYGLYLVFYQDGVTLNYGTAPQVRVIGSVGNKWYDGKTHQLKFIIKNNKAAVLVDGEILFKDIQVAMQSGYFTLQSSNTQDWVDELSIINYAEPLSKPNPDGDIATKPNVSAPVTDDMTTGKAKPNGVWLGLTITFSVLTVGLAGVFAFLLAKKKKK